MPLALHPSYDAGAMEQPFVVLEGGTFKEAIRADALVPWWSFTKTVIAAAALVLVQQKRLDLDQPLADRPYNLRQLLQHRAGVADYGPLKAYHEAVGRGDEPWPVSVILERTQADRLRFRPGEGWGYSNIGYFFVRELIERVCGCDLAAALSALVLNPLGAEMTRLAGTPADLAGVIMGVDHYHPGWAYHGLLVGPLREAVVLLDRLMTGGLLSQDLIDQMRNPWPLSDVPISEGRPWTEAGYGLGLMCPVASNGLRVSGHTGGGPGSVVAVYRLQRAEAPYTAAAFDLGGDPASVENKTMKWPTLRALRKS